MIVISLYTITSWHYMKKTRAVQLKTIFIQPPFTAAGHFVPTFWKLTDFQKAEQVTEPQTRSMPWLLFLCAWIIYLQTAHSYFSPTINVTNPSAPQSQLEVKLFGLTGYSTGRTLLFCVSLRVNIFFLYDYTVKLSNWTWRLPKVLYSFSAAFLWPGKLDTQSFTVI